MDLSIFGYACFWPPLLSFAYFRIRGLHFFAAGSPVSLCRVRTLITLLVYLFVCPVRSSVSVSLSSRRNLETSSFGITTRAKLSAGDHSARIVGAPLFLSSGLPSGARLFETDQLPSGSAQAQGPYVLTKAQWVAAWLSRRANCLHRRCKKFLQRISSEIRRPYDNKGGTAEKFPGAPVRATKSVPPDRLGANGGDQQIRCAPDADTYLSSITCLLCLSGSYLISLSKATAAATSSLWILGAHSLAACCFLLLFRWH